MIKHKIVDSITLIMIMLFVLILTSFAVNYIAGTPFPSEFTALTRNILNVIFALTIIMIIVVLVLENANSVHTLAWILILLYLPVVGFIFYLFFGRNWRKTRIFSRKGLTDSSSIDELVLSEYITEEDLELSEIGCSLINLLESNSKAILTHNNDIELIPETAAAFDAILRGILSAKHHIHLEYFSIANDSTGRVLKDVLIQKAREGLEIRFIYDDVGSWHLSKRFKTELRKAGVQFLPFMPVLVPFINSRANYRNHRKLVIVDGCKAYLGGLNIGDQYLGKSKYFGYWRDSLVAIYGDGVRSLQAIFLTDWFFVSGENLLVPKYFSTDENRCLQHYSPPRSTMIQIAASGPDTEHSSIMQAYFLAISKAKKSIRITTPYLILNESLLMALKTAALSGIKVQIIVPSKADHYIVFMGSRSYFEELMTAGVEIYEYIRGFIHAKVLIIDDEIVSIGTANMDMRSFNHNFEITAMIYDRVAGQIAAAQFTADLNHSRRIIPMIFAQRSLFKKSQESICRLFSPVL